MNFCGKFRVVRVEAKADGRVVHLSAVASRREPYEHWTPYGTYRGTASGDAPDGLNVGADVVMYVRNPAAFAEADALRPGDTFGLSANELYDRATGGPVKA